MLERALSKSAQTEGNLRPAQIAGTLRKVLKTAQVVDPANQA